MVAFVLVLFVVVSHWLQGLVSEEIGGCGDRQRMWQCLLVYGAGCT